MVGTLGATLERPKYLSAINQHGDQRPAALCLFLPPGGSSPWGAVDVLPVA